MSFIFTIGYEGTDIERFVSTLRSTRIRFLIDVRAVPHSRKRGFSKKALKSRLEEERIEYLHLIDLGDPKPGRDAAKEGRLDEFKQIYINHLRSVEAQKALQTLARVARTETSCLMCFEREPAVCHRSLIANALSASGMEVFDLYGDSPRRYDDFREQSCYFGQGITAAE